MADQASQVAALQAAADAVKQVHVQLFATRYLTVAGAVIALLEFTSGFSGELELIWKGRRGTERNVFLVHRFIVVVGLLCAVQMTAGLAKTMSDTVGTVCFANTLTAYLTTSQDCKVLIGLVGSLAATSVCLADGLVTMEVWQLWDCNWKVMRWMLFAYILECLGTLGFLTATVFNIITRNGGFTYEVLVQSCTLHFAPRWLAGSWACGLAFETTMLVCMVLNLLDKPRAANVRLTRLLVRDGFAYFLAVIGLRTLNLVIASTSEPASFFIPTFCSWAFVTVLVNRLVVNQCRERHRLRFSVHLKSDLSPLDLMSTPQSPQSTDVFELTTRVTTNVQVVQETRSDVY
ncbi:hypothetical protein EXIGLDRAFT_840294 [Exidia glandulosa HHB12029]|uniref:Transmembrane protein n=1 Tax=Exidia glandulosa HHB12029 TaxID=1314781 RepID=A0A165EJ97_EXIGL|nr:hypothetical protein EXIGLDRAFT_840294 [Exidia glandulosa HHB12029]